MSVLFFAFCLSEALPLKGQRPEQKKKYHIVFLISEDPDNYEAPRTIPIFAEALTKKHGFKVTVILGEGERTAFRYPNLEVISQADLVIVFSRRVALSHEQLALIRNYLKQGKPLVGIRTAHHAFSAVGEIKDGHEAWPEFPAEILGCQNRGYGPQELGTEVAVVPGSEKHPILKGFEPGQWHADGSTYHVAPLLDTKATILVTGKVKEKVEPAAWTRYTADGSRVFYTSLGYPSDFDKPQFNNLLVNGIFWALDLKIP
ncbi:MAG: ThuA domain-containing protein [Cyclobacteriaceae bacterium]